MFNKKELRKRVDKIDWHFAVIKDITEESKQEALKREQKQMLKLLQKDLGRRR